MFCLYYIRGYARSHAVCLCLCFPAGLWALLITLLHKDMKTTYLNRLTIYNAYITLLQSQFLGTVALKTWIQLCVRMKCTEWLWVIRDLFVLHGQIEDVWRLKRGRGCSKYYTWLYSIVEYILYSIKYMKQNACKEFEILSASVYRKLN